MNIDKVLNIFKKAQEEDPNTMVDLLANYSEDLYIPIEDLISALDKFAEGFAVQNENDAKIAEILKLEADLVKGALVNIMPQLKDLNEKLDEFL